MFKQIIKHFSLSAFALALLLPSYTVFSADDDWSDDEWEDEEVATPWLLSGFIELATGRFLRSNIVSSTSQLKEMRSRFDLSYSHELFEFNAKGDLLFDEVIDETFWQSRELNLAFSPFESLDIKVGRQVLTWGTGDYLFLNDLFAKDWQSFFSGREDEYLKAPSDSLRTTWYLGDLSLDLAWTPTFTADRFLTGERFSFYSAQAKALIAPADNFKVEENSNGQLSARLATTKNGVEYALYGYKGYWTTPVGVNERGLPYFPKLNSWGASARLPLAEGLFNAEFTFYNSLEDPIGDKTNIANDQFKALVGFERELIKNLTASIQYYLERTLDYQEFKKGHIAPDEIVDEDRQLLTLRLNHFAWQQKLNSSLFIFYSPTDKDSYVKYSISYRASDNWSYALGANIFSGKNNYSFFGQHQDNSNAWLRARYQY